MDFHTRSRALSAPTNLSEPAQALNSGLPDAAAQGLAKRHPQIQPHGPERTRALSDPLRLAASNAGPGRRYAVRPSLAQTRAPAAELAVMCREDDWELAPAIAQADASLWFTERNQVVPGALQELSSGDCFTVYSVSYRQMDGATLNAVFKPCDRETAMCNLATHALAVKLGFNVIVDTRIAVASITEEYGTTRQLGIAMELARGMEPGEICLTGGEDLYASYFNDPAVTREITKLQLVDDLAAQRDRNLGNYRILREHGGAVRVSGFDSDDSFIARYTHPNQLADLSGFMPPVIDTEMAAAIESLAPNEVASILAPMMNHEQVQATLSRLNHLKAHVQTLRDEGNVVTPQTWMDDWEHLAEQFNQRNCYFVFDPAEIE